MADRPGPGRVPPAAEGRAGGRGVTDPPGGRAAAPRRREIGLGMLRALATTTALVALYYLLPLDRLASNVPLAVTLGAGLAILVAVASWQLRTVLRARYPAVRAAIALAATVPLFLLLFASAYYVAARGTPGSFSQQLTRTDALYFTVTTFTTVGFGDITAVSQTARLVVTVQMILDLLALGLGIRVFIGAVKRAREAQSG